MTDEPDRVCGKDGCEEPAFRGQDFCSLEHEVQVTGRDGALSKFDLSDDDADRIVEEFRSEDGGSE